MSRRLLLNLVLLATLGVLVLLIWHELVPPPDHGRVGTRTAAEIDRIVVERADGEMLRLSRSWDRWQLHEPRMLPASLQHVEMVLALLDARSEVRYPASSLDLAVLGLSEPRLRVSLGDQVFVFGGIEPLSQRRYVLYRNEVFLILDTVSPLLLGPWWNFIDRSLLGREEEIVAVELSDGRLLVGADARALVERWRATSASIVRPVERAEGAAEPLVEMRLASGEAVRWYLAADGDQPRLVRPDLQLAYHIDWPTLRFLTEDMDGEAD